MFLLRQFPAALLAAVFFAPAQAADDAVSQYGRQLAAPHAGERVVLAVDLAASPGFSTETRGQTAELRYRMVFNNIAEGWSWQPQANPAVDDYYRYKFLPLQSVTEARGEYVQEDKTGVSQQTQVVWRYDYFLAFDNLYDFYPRAVDDDAGFVATIPLATAPHIGIQAIARLIDPVVSESTTFWKAIYSKPVDFTLKKRYLVGVLEEIDFVDTRNGEVVQRLRAAAPEFQR